jgi:hypothetical protein
MNDANTTLDDIEDLTAELIIEDLPAELLIEAVEARGEAGHMYIRVGDFELSTPICAELSAVLAFVEAVRGV